MNIYHFESLASTQDIAKQYLADGRDLPFAVRADIQTKGRGRSGNEWISPVGNLYSSTVIPVKNIPVQNAGQYSFLTAVALMETLADYGVTNAVNKWPNDILVDSKKIAGILLESDVRQDGTINALIIGVGVNIAFAPEGAVCLDTILKSPPLRGEDLGEGENFLKIFLENLQSNLTLFEENGFVPIREKWLAKAFGLNETIRVRLPHETFYGVFTGLDEQGALLVNVDGTLRKVYSGDVFF